MRIMFVSYKLSDGGAERVLSSLANELNKLGNDITIIRYQQTDDEYRLDNEIKIVDLGRRASRGGTGFSRSVNRIKTIREIIKSEKPDCVIPFLDSMVRESRIASLGLKTKLIATVRNSPYHTPDTRIARTLRNLFCLFSSYVFVQNNEQKKYFSKSIQKKTFVVPNPIMQNVHMSEKKYSNEIIRFVTCGRLHEQKNHKMLIDAFSVAATKYPGIVLSIYGTGSQEKELRYYVEKKGMQERIFICGRTNDVVTVLLDNDCFLLSSDFEGMPNALMEAMAVGLPCISTACPTGPSDIIQQGQNGILVPVNDSEAMANAICKMIQNPSVANHMGCKARQFMTKFSQEEIAQELLNNLKSIVFNGGLNA